MSAISWICCWGSPKQPKVNSAGNIQPITTAELTRIARDVIKEIKGKIKDSSFIDAFPYPKRLE
ncbi:hypothetical protein DID78_02280 [Candidatus Marinamargulisbacteria bacterium SCGC AG-343-D04]|nr:hypothetical protein DID78_02280 [Candidatus Marinamargulisbacteria bacterium SCGC AG-343-D04]